MIGSATGDLRRAAPALRALKLTLTEACNLTCPYCYQRARHGRPMSLATLRAALGLARELGGEEVRLLLSGGEPLLAPELVEEVIGAATTSESTSPRLRIRLITNGTMLTQPLLARLVASDTELQVSCDGVAEAQDRRAAGTWRDLDRLLGTIRGRYPAYWERRLALAMTVSPDNLAHLPRSVAWALERDVHRIEVALVCCPPAGGRPWDESALAARMEEVYALSLEHLRRTERIPVAYLRSGSSINPSGADTCGAADVTSLAVAADGSVHGCGMLADVARWHPARELRQVASSLRLGHVADADLAMRWRERASRPSPIVFPVAERRSSGEPCRDCLDRGTCMVCPLAGSDPRQVPGAHCRFERLAQRQRRTILQESPLGRWLAEAGIPEPERTRLASRVQEARQQIH